MTDFQNDSRIVFHTSLFNETRTFYEGILGVPILSEWDHGKVYKKGVVYRIGNLNVEFLEVDDKDKTTCNNAYLYIEIDDTPTLKTLRIMLCKIDKGVTTIESFPWGHTSFKSADPNNINLKFYTKETKDI